MLKKRTVKIIANFFKYLTLVILILFLFKTTKYYGNYKQTVYDIIIIPITVFLILINCLFLYSIQQKSNDFKLLKIILYIGLIGILFNLTNNYFESKRDILTEYEINEKSILKLFKNNTFQITENSPLIFQHWKGEYNFSNDTLYLKNIDFGKSSTLQLSNKYFRKNESKILFSNDSGFLTPIKLKHSR